MRLFLAVCLLVVFGSLASAGVLIRGHFGTAPPIPSASLSVAPTTINQGATATLTWSSARATSCTGTNFSTSGTTSGSLIVSPIVTTTYSITCTNITGQASASAALTVNPGAPVASLTANPTTILLGQSTTLTWSSSNSTTCSGGGFSTGGATSGSATAAPVITTTFSVTCTGAGGSNTASALVTVNTGGVSGGNCADLATAPGCVLLAGSTNRVVDGLGHTWGFNNAVKGPSPPNGGFSGYTEVDRDGSPACCSIFGGVDGGGYATVIVLDSNKQIHTKAFDGAWFTTNNTNAWSGIPGTGVQYQPPGQPGPYDFAPSHVTLAPDPAWITTTSGAGTTALSIGAPGNDLYAPNDANLTITAFTVPNNGTVFLADAVTVVNEGTVLTLAQLQGLLFKPTSLAYRASRSSAFTFKVCDPATSCRVGQVSMTVLGNSLWADPPGWAGPNGGGNVSAPQIIQPSVAGDLVGMRWSNTSGSAAGYVSQGHIFLMGALKPSDLTGGAGVCGKTDIAGGSLSGCTTYVQVDVHNHWPDGSIKWTNLSYLLPSFTSSQVFAEVMFAKCTAGNCPAAPSPVAKSATALAAGATQSMQFTPGGTANCNTALTAAINAGPVTQWLSGPVVNEFNVGGVLGNGLHFQCDMRVYADSTTHTEFSSDNTFVFSGGVFGGGTTYSYTVVGSDGYTNGGATITQYPYSTWQHDIDSAGIINPNPQIDVPYLMATGAIIPVDASFGGSANNLGGASDAPMTCANVTGCGGTDMQAPGTRPDLGPLTNWEGMWLVTQNPTAYATAVANAHAAGSAPWGFKDTTTSLLVNGNNILGSCGQTGTGTYQNCNPRVPSTHPSAVANWLIADSHLPNLAYLTTIIRGRRYDLQLKETMANFVIVNNPGRGSDSLDFTGKFTQGVLSQYSFSNPSTNPYPSKTEIRATGWDLRETLEAAFLVPDSDALSSYFIQAAKDAAIGHAQQYIANDMQAQLGDMRGYIGHLNGGGGPNTDAEHWDNYSSMVGLGAGMALPTTSGQFAAGVRWQSNLHEGLLTHGPDGFLARNATMYQANIAPDWGPSGAGNSNSAFYNTYAAYYANNISSCSDVVSNPSCNNGSNGGLYLDGTLGGLNGYPRAQIQHPTNAEEGYPTEWRSEMSAAVSTLSGIARAHAIQGYAFDLNLMRYSWTIYGGASSPFDTNCAGGGGGSPCWMQYTNAPVFPNGDTLFQTQERYDVTNGTSPTLTASGTSNSLLGIVGNGNMIFTGKSVAGAADVMTASTIGTQSADGLDLWDTGPGSALFNAGTSDTFMFGSCASGTFKPGAGSYYYMVGSGNCYPGRENGHPTPKPNTYTFGVDQLTNAVNVIERFNPAQDIIHVKVNFNSSSIASGHPEQFTSNCTTKVRTEIVTMAAITDTICTLANGATVTLLNVSQNITSRVQVP